MSATTIDAVLVVYAADGLLGLHVLPSVVNEAAKTYDRLARYQLTGSLTPRIVFIF